MSSIQIFLGHEITDDELRKMNIEESHIESCLQPQIDFVLVCDPPVSNEGILNLYDSKLYSILRNLGDWVSPQWEIIDFRGENKLVAIFWH
jgi:hypothetical protein